MIRNAYQKLGLHVAREERKEEGYLLIYVSFIKTTNITTDSA